MLVRDIDLDDAIVDLVDNCVDGARRSRTTGDFSGLWVRVTLDAEKFQIEDNCGGIPLDLARDYAFCFGRPVAAKGVEHSIGRFGVGMKRAFFKIGERFRVETLNGTDHYEVGADVRAWRGIDTWTFPLIHLEGTPSGSQAGTKVTVSGLYEPVAHDFADEPWVEDLRTSIGAKHHWALSQNLGITINGIPANFARLALLNSDQLAPAVSAFEMKLRKTVGVRVVAGLGHSSPSDAGWYIYCNGRSVLRADTSPHSGWGGGVIPKFHNQFAEFRGFAFIECDDTDLLPWRTTKTGVDTESIVYRRVLQEMVDLTRPVVDFLNQKKEEMESAREEERLLGRAVDSAASANSVVDADKLLEKQSLKVPTPSYTPLPEEARISYWETVERIRRAKTQLGVRANREVGRRTFDYFYQAEVEG